jgi:excisionase family DNA binding protein
MADFLTTADAAQLLHVTGATVRSYEERGLLPSVRTERGWRLFLRDDVERLAPRVPMKAGRPRKATTR